MRGTFEHGTRVRLSFWQATRSCKHGGWYGRSECQWEKMHEMTHLLHCIALHFVRQVFAQSRSSLGLPSPLWIQKQSKYLHAIHHAYWSMWPTREAKPGFATALKCSAHDCETCLLSTVLRNMI